MSQLPPAYRGAPYYQHRRQPRKQRVVRIVKLLAIAALAVMLYVLIGAAVAPAAFPEPSTGSTWARAVTAPAKTMTPVPVRAWFTDRGESFAAIRPPQR